MTTWGDWNSSQGHKTQTGNDEGGLPARYITMTKKQNHLQLHHTINIFYYEVFSMNSGMEAGQGKLIMESKK